MSEKILDRINKTGDIKKIRRELYPQLAEEIREFMIEKISKSGGHLASSLGVVELTMALHTAFNLPKDKIIWDVGHQCYTHKILTGRKDSFDTIRSLGGISGFPKRQESECDAFDTGHSSTSVSAGLGMVNARRLNGEKNKIVSVIGDGALTGGLAYEALNNAGQLKENFIIILNDNNMSISQNIGSVSRMMTNIRTAPKYTDFKSNVVSALEKIPKVGGRIIKKIRGAKSTFKSLFIPGMFFEDMGLTYLGPVDGHNIDDLLFVLEDAKRVKGAVVVHVMTEKGHGYDPAMRDPERFHGIGKFDPETGECLCKKEPDYSRIFGGIMCKLAEKNDKIACISAAMPEGTGLKNFAKRFPSRFFDVGIAEEHAVTFAAGLAAGGAKPYVCVYSSFMQRAYDQILHDVCMQKLPVTFALDRAGLVGADGETHQGLFDISFLSSMPNMTLIAPKNAAELVAMMRYSETFDGPLAVRYPRGTADRLLEEYDAPIEYGRAEPIVIEKDIALLAVGTMTITAMKVMKMLRNDGKKVSVINARFIHPFDREIISELAQKHKYLITLEENVASGGFGQQVSAYIKQNGIKLKTLNISVPDAFVEQGTVDELRRRLGIDADGIFARVKEFIS